MDGLLLQALREKKRFTTLLHAVPQGMMAPDTLGMLAWYNAYFQAFPERERVEVDELQSLIRLRAGNASQESIAITLHLSEQLRAPPDDTAVSGILGQLYELDLAGRAGALLAKYNSNEEVDLSHELQRMAAETVKSLSSGTAEQFVNDDIGDLLAQLGRDDGLKWGFIKGLAMGVGGLLPGDSAMFAARVDAGKTSFLCKTATCFAPQVVPLFGVGRPILFLNNESLGARIKPRLYQAALGVTIPEMIELHRAGKLEDMYRAALGGTEILLKDIHGASLAQVERLIQQVEPIMTIIDMPANLRMHVGNGSKTDALEQAWQQLRELAAIHKLVMLGTAQISIEGADQLYPPMTALKDTKTGVQGALDLQINMGNLNNPAAATLRGISTPKNKKSRTGQPSCVQTEVYFDKDRCQFNDGSGATQ